MKQPLLFRYSGNKRNIVPLLRTLPTHRRIVEPYLGAGGCILSCNSPALGIDINHNIVDLWRWLKKDATPERLSELQNIVKEAVDKSPDNKPNAKDLGLTAGELAYVRINVTGVYVGQLSSWKIYPQHKLPIEQTISFLPRLKNVEVLHGTADRYVEEDGDVVFIDPPYTHTSANYKQDGKGGIEEGYDPASTVRLIRRIKSPIIFTYGTNAPEVFPEFEWQVVLKKRVPRIRVGGTLERIEHVAYINWS